RRILPRVSVRTGITDPAIGTVASQAADDFDVVDRQQAVADVLDPNPDRRLRRTRDVRAFDREAVELDADVDVLDLHAPIFLGLDQRDIDLSIAGVEGVVVAAIDTHTGRDVDRLGILAARDQDVGASAVHRDLDAALNR